MINLEMANADKHNMDDLIMLFSLGDKYLISHNINHNILYSLHLICMIH